ncbi:unnamed protein product [Microthlaspi erraticum]|uniref:Uncharacterized protein n=1 Tax=Microthlaspi erraticum TaxID=1685480 RepID=A0A6D2I741_9BRAS|nr:unnamed protein product [Microthlaspi erraticum]
MSSPEKRKKKTTTKELLLPPTPQSTPNLPDDLLLSCFARVSRLYYPTLSLASKGFGSLIASPELYKTRSRLHRTEICLYVCLSLPHDPNPRWFTLCRRPNRALTKEKNLGMNLLVPIASPPSTPVKPCFVAVGSEIYQISGRVNDVPSCDVSVLDCRSHSWHQAPNMNVVMHNRSAIVVDGKIHVKGEEVEGFESPMVEVYDPKTLTWKFELHGSEESFLRDDFAAGLPLYCCVIDEVIYYLYDNGRIFWCDLKSKELRILKGVTGLPEFNRSDHDARLVDYGGNLAVLWEDHGRSSNSEEKMIWCAVIAVDRSNREEFTGTVEWFDPVLEVTESCSFVRVLAATV